MKPKHYTQNEILEGSRIGIEFEFFSKISPEKIGKLLGEKLKKKIVIPKNIPELGKSQILVYHSDVDVTDEVFKLEADYSGGFDMFELITGPLPYKDARKTIISVLDWISIYGYTTERCSIHLNISFSENLNSTVQIKDMNILKFILNFDEKKIYDVFPDRKDSVYAKSIKKDITYKTFFQNHIPVDFDLKNLVNTPNEKYYGINFLKAADNYLEFRYLGGKDYENKTPKILDMLDFFIQSLFYNINFPNYTQDETNKLKNLFIKFQKDLKHINDFIKFKKDFKDLKITVDLKNNEQHIITYWDHIKYRIFELVSKCGLKKGNVNYDTELGRLQLYECDLSYSTISDLDLVGCSFKNMSIYNCELFYTGMENCIVKNSNAVRENLFKDSKIKETNIYATNTCDNCVIENNNEIVNGRYIKGIIRKGTIGSLAKLEGTIKVEDQIEKNTKSDDKKIVKDWKWIKKLKKP